MPKKIKFESFKYRLLVAAKKYSIQLENHKKVSWDIFVNSLNFKSNGNKIFINSSLLSKDDLDVDISLMKFYVRGDLPKYVDRQYEYGLINQIDKIKLNNETQFDTVVISLAKWGGFLMHDKNGSKSDLDKRLEAEKIFHDAWAQDAKVDFIDVIAINEVCTAPEMRYITKKLGNIHGKTLLDIGCGLGEASVYFALKGAKVTSSDLSGGMLQFTQELARVNGVEVTPHLSSAEDLKLPPEKKFDIIYLGNLLHHVDIQETLSKVKRHLAPNGILVSWDPVEYNPIINVYRKMATDVRTPDEHPLKTHDIKTFKKNFLKVETKFFWLTTLVIFIFMAVFQKRNPNKERFWKVILNEGKKWSWLYNPLAALDRIIIFLCPPLGWLCWNVVIIARNPR